MKHLILALVLTVPTIASAQGTSFVATQFGGQGAIGSIFDTPISDLNLRDYAAGIGIPGTPQYGSSEEELRYRRQILKQQQEYQRQLLEQQQRQNDLLEQQIQNQIIHTPQNRTTDCQPNGYGGFVCSTR